MSKSALVRFSRDGDQFHYLWAARRCLMLLSPTSRLVAVSIEGLSTDETPADAAAVDAGAEVIDVAEYYGSESLAQAARVRYIQLKHSTQHSDEPWLPSGLKSALEGFGKRYRSVEQQLGSSILAKLEFCFISNRPLSSNLTETVEDARNGAAPRHPDVLRLLETYTGLASDSFCAFCRLLNLEGEQSPYWDQRNLLTLDTSKHLPNADVDAPLRLKELVTRKATSEGSEKPQITKIDVLRALETDEDALFPAPSLIGSADHLVPRQQEAQLIEDIVGAVRQPVIIHAEGGVGKSVFATRIGGGLPEGSVCV